MNTDGGQLHASGQFMSGYAPIIKDSGVTGVSTASDFEKGLFDATAYTVGGHTVTCSAFSMTISNPATRVGWVLDESSHPTADGYSRAGLFDIYGTITVKYDANTDSFFELFHDQASYSDTGVTIMGTDGTPSNEEFEFLMAKSVLTNVAFAEGDIMALDVSVKAVATSVASTDKLFEISC